MIKKGKDKFVGIPISRTFIPTRFCNVSNTLSIPSSINEIGLI